MSNQLKIEDVFLQIRSVLQANNVKLWLPPYYDQSTGPCEEELQKLSEDYSRTLKISKEECYAALSELQQNALEKLKQREHFKESGVATIKIKLLSGANSKLLTKEVSLNLSARNFKEIISTDVKVSAEKLKLISNGKVIHDDKTLAEQAVKNGNLILALVLAESPTEIENAVATVKELENVKADTQLLATSDSDDYMQLEDQAGNAICIPKNEKKSLMVAMALHEKGRSAMKKKDYAKALVYLLDADEEFSRCNSQLLSCIDNYALLDLDIVWCYLSLRSVANLPEAYQRLQRCEQNFHKSYGENLERLIALKGSPGNEAVLFMRLHLLQAIVLYHQNKRKQSLQLLKKAQQELQTLKVDENSITMLIELGYSTAEARLGLRATNCDVNLAANFINENREKRAQSRRKSKADRIVQREKKKLGKCKDGNQYVNPEFVKMLVNMGYNREAARVALQNTNNNISESIQFIQENPQAGPSSTKSQELLKYIDYLIPELVAAGFDTNMARLALKKHGGDIMKAAEELLANGGFIEGNMDDFDDDEKRNKLEKMKEEAYERLAEDISMVDDDHLDLTLEEEEIFLNEYLSLLELK